MSGPASRSATSTSPTTAACARSRRRRARTSASSVRSATYARVNAFGFIESPYRKVTQRQGHRRHHLAHRRRGRGLRRRPGQRAARRQAARSRTSGSSCAGRRRPPPSRTCASSSSATPTSPPPPRSPRCRRPRSSSWTSRRSRSSRSAPSLIPFLEHDDANRALMGANMQKQAVPLVQAEAPYIGTGVEARAARDAADMIIAEDDGVVTECSGDAITVEYKTQGQARSSSSSSSSARTRTPASTRSRACREGETFKKGDILADGPSTDNGELALGKNLLVAFMPWEGYNFEDAIILSRAPGEGRRAHVDPHPRARDRRPRHQARPGGDHPGHPEPLRGDPQGPRRARASSASAPRSAPATCSSARSPPRARPSSPPRSASCAPSSVRRPARSATPRLKVPHGEEGKVIDVKVFTREDGHELPPGVNQLVRVYVGQKRKISVGDKLAGRHGNKGVISKILPVEDMPFLADGTPGRHHPQPPRRPVPHERGPGPRGPPRLRRPVGLGGRRREGRRRPVPRHRGQDPHQRPRRPPSSPRPVFDGAHWDEEEQAGQAPDDPDDLREPHARVAATPSTATAAG